MKHRTTHSRPLAILVACSLALAAACGADQAEVTSSDDSNHTAGSTPTAAGLVAVPERITSATDPALAGASVADFGHRLLTSAATTKAPDANVVVSPLSVAIALAMVEPGASGDAIPQLHALLGIDDPAAWHASMNALEQSLEARAPAPIDPSLGEGQAPGELLVRIANAGFLQPGYPFRADYLDVIGSNYGAVLEELDFARDQEAAAERINAFIADATDDHITDLVGADAINPRTVLALVNALLMRASWLTEFDATQTVADGTFTLLDDATVTVPMMHGGSDHSGLGDGWAGASKALVGGLRFEVVLPDAGRFDEVAGRYASIVAELAASPNPGGELVVPRFETRVNTELSDALKAMGLPAPFGGGAMMGIADDPELVVDKVLHEAWLSIDETGIEAAAATVVLMMAVSAPIDEPVPVVLDRPFLFRIVDDASLATLFTGRIMNPTA